MEGSRLRNWPLDCSDMGGSRIVDGRCVSKRQLMPKLKDVGCDSERNTCALDPTRNSGGNISDPKQQIAVFSKKKDALHRARINSTAI